MIEAGKFQDFLTIGKIPYFISLTLLALGLVSGFIIDLQGQSFFIILMDIVAAILFSISHILVIKTRLNRGRAILINLLTVMIIFFISGIIQVHEEEYQKHFEANVLITLLQSGLFASILGIAVNKLAAVIVSFITVAYLLFMVISTGNPFLNSIFFLVSLLIAGNILVVFFYRGALEGLLSKLNTNLIELQSKNYALQQLKSRAESLNTINQPFITFGKNMGGFIHDLNNDIGNLSMQLQLLDIKLAKEIAIVPKDLETAQKAMQRLNGRVEMVRFLAQANHEEAIQEFMLSTLIESALYPFKISNRFYQKIRFTASYPSETIIRNKRFHLLRILENLIQNSCEAIIDNAFLAGQDSGIMGNVEIITKLDDNQFEIRVIDNGPGIDGCRDCENPNCLDCKHFEIGKSSKPYGSGYGMVNIINLCQEIDAKLEIESGKNSGSCVSIKLVN